MSGRMQRAIASIWCWGISVLLISFFLLPKCTSVFLKDGLQLVIFSLQLLKEIHPSYRNYDIIDEKRQAAIIVSKYLDFGLDKLQGANSKIETIRRFIETLNIIYRENLDVDNLKNQDLINSVHQYQNFIKQRPNCFLTFDEIIAELTSVIESNEAIRAQVQNRFTNIFVDEYQDVDDRQEQLIRLLSNDGQTAAVCAVGDDDQAMLYAIT